MPNIYVSFNCQCDESDSSPGSETSACGIYLSLHDYIFQITACNLTFWLFFQFLPLCDRAGTWEWMCNSTNTTCPSNTSGDPLFFSMALDSALTHTLTFQLRQSSLCRVAIIQFTPTCLNGAVQVTTLPPGGTQGLHTAAWCHLKNAKCPFLKFIKLSSPCSVIDDIYK